MKKPRRACVQWVAVGLTLVVSAAPCLAQPAMSRGQQQLPTNYADCLNRARQALSNVGFSVAGAGNFAQGFKDTSGAYIICNDAPSGGVIVNIVVATNTNDAGVPGNLRQLLQAQMERPAAALPPSGAAVACGDWDWLDHVRVTLHPDGTSNNQSGGQGQWEVLPDGRVHLYWKTYNSNDYLTFVDANTANGNFNGRPARITRVGACPAR